MIPYAPLNGVSLSWCSLTERLIKRHDLWLIKAESFRKEIDFNLQGERGEEKRQAGEISAEGTVGMPWFAMQGQGAFYGVSLRQHRGRAEPGPAPKSPAGFFPQSHTANPGLVFQLKDKRNQHLSSHLLLYLTLFITLMDCVTIKKLWGGCQPGGLFSSRMQKKVWDANHFRSTHMELWDAPSLRDGAGPPTGTKQPSEKRGILAFPFHHCSESGKQRWFLLKHAFLSHMQTFLQSLAGFFQPFRKAFPAHPVPRPSVPPTHTQIPSR